MNSKSALNVVVKGGGAQVVAHAGLHALGRFADRIGLPVSLSAAIKWSGERAPLHDRGKALTHAMLMLAAAGEACTDIEFLGSQQRLFGDVCSDSTLYRTIRNITPNVLADVGTATATVRSKMWQRMGATTGKAMVVLDIDASLVRRAVQVRTDSAGCTSGFVHGCRARHVGFAVVVRSNSSIHYGDQPYPRDRSG